MATNIRYVDPDAAAGGDGTTNGLTGATCAYVSLSTWEAARQADLVTATNIERAVCCSNGGSHTADTTAVTIDGWTTSASYYIEIQAEVSYGGKWDATKYRLTNSASSIIVIYENFIKFRQIQFQITSIAADFAGCIYIPSALSGSNLIELDRCLFKGVLSASANAIFAVWNKVSTNYYNLYNCIIQDFKGGTNDTIAGFYDTGVVNIYSTTIYNCYKALWQFSGTWIAKNVAEAGGSTTDSGTITKTTCSAYNSTPTFVSTTGTYDLHLQSGDTVCKDSGTDTSGDAAPLNFTTDIDGQTRSGTWDIGADEYISSGVSIDISDLITVSENVSLLLTTLNISINESITISENIGLYITSLNIDINDISTVSENVVLSIQSISQLNVDVSDSITITENINILIPVLFTSVSDLITITENISLFITALFINSNDSITITENLSASVSTAGVTTKGKIALKIGGGIYVFLT